MKKHENVVRNRSNLGFRSSCRSYWVLSAGPKTWRGFWLEKQENNGTTNLPSTNDDDDRNPNTYASYIEWTCPASGTYYIMVQGYGSSTGTFGLTLTQGGAGGGGGAGSGDPCNGGITFQGGA